MTLTSPARRSMSFGLVLVAFGGSLLGAGTFPMSRDAAISELIGSYSLKCLPRTAEALKISESECAARAEGAKKTCPALIADGLPPQIDEKQLSRLVARASGCHMRTIMGKPYDNAPYDRSAAEMSQAQPGS